MTSVSSGARHGLLSITLNLAAASAALVISSDAADARHHHRGRFHHYASVQHHPARVHHHAHAEAYAPPFASIVVDGNSGGVLQASNPDASRHPASLTKIMTLYLLFERLDAGKVRLDTPLKVSQHASEQAPTKLGLKPGQTISVEDAIKGIVTRSANDAAAVIAENLGGNEEEFARLMTRKAHALGMSRTTYVNASGLPDDDQITTARDQALLGRAIQERFPRYYKYFATPTFVYHGEAIRNHDHLLTQVEGVDGIKTGFTRASGFNLVTSLHRDNHYMVGVVLGGRSSFERDAHMRSLLAEHFKEAALHRTAPAIAERTEHEDDSQPVAFAKPPSPAPSSTPATTAAANRPDPVAANSPDERAEVGSSDPIRPLLVRTVTFRTAPAQTAPLGPLPALVAVAPVGASAARSQATVAAAPAPKTELASADPADVTATTAAPAPAPAASTAATETPRSEPSKAEPASAAPAALHAHGGWLIQIGAFDGENEARAHLNEAQVKVHGALAAADPFTERVQKGDKSLFRARFAGFDKATAEAACKELKRSDFDCMALKD